MILAVAGLLVAAQISEAHLTIDVTTNQHIVTAEYVVDAAGGEVFFDAIRWPGQTISLRDSTSLAIQDLGGLVRVRTSAPSQSVRLAYEVQGNLTRIPLFVPNIPTVPGVSTVEITVRNAPTLSVVDAFPRFTRGNDGLLRAQPANLPSFVLLPVQTRISRARVADSVVVLFLLCASGVWLYRKIRAA